MCRYPTGMQYFQHSGSLVSDHSALRRRLGRHSAPQNSYPSAVKPSANIAQAKVIRLTIDVEDTRLAGQIRAMLPDGSRVLVDLVEPCGEGYPDSFEKTYALFAFDLTERQREVVRLLMKGLSNKAIARSLSLSHFTVRNHISQVMRVLGVGSRKDVRVMLGDIPLDPLPAIAAKTVSSTQA